MTWSNYKKGITSLDPTELKTIEIVAQLVQRRIELKLTQTDLATKTGLKQAAISRLESEKAIPRLDTLERVTRALDLELALVKEDKTVYEIDKMSN
ncbi:helix-turn-helix transcriptional regulator [Amphibacillus indicireducens]|uniref:HTH cro/C1-type domain-containing protein n=1 Tax=Amphibacillus indicireducens TaxID=1076330 RepID=A0ABP7VQ90_9BACI